VQGDRENEQHDSSDPGVVDVSGKGFARVGRVLALAPRQEVVGVRDEGVGAIQKEGT
jgi:hypothetical protein